MTSKYQSRHYFDLRDGREGKKKKQKQWAWVRWGKCILEFWIFSVVQVNQSQSLWKGLFRIALLECCLLTLLWVPDQLHVCSSAGNRPNKEKTKRDVLEIVTTKQQQRSRTVWTLLSYPLIIPIWVIPRCAVLSLSISRVWRVGERSTITIVATWKHKDTN